jgi:hypothetical protein
MTKYTFLCEGIDASGKKAVTEQYFIHETEEEARRGLIYTLNHLFHFYPRKLRLKRMNKWEQSPFLFD